MNTVRISAWLVLVGFGLGNGSAYGQEPAKAAGRKLTVNGSATILVHPDAARLTFAVTAIDATAKTARNENEKQVKKIKDSLASLAIANVDVHVVPSAVSTMIAADANPDGSPRIMGRQAQSVFFVTVREKEVDKLRGLVAKIVDTAADNGGTGMADESSPVIRLPRRLLGVTENLPGPKIEWLAENSSEAHRVAIKGAITDALANAQAAAGKAEVRIIEIQVSPGEAYSVRIRSPFNPGRKIAGSP